jgi:hypothetical protein
MKMPSLGNVAAYIAEQGAAGIKERRESQLADYQFQQMRQKAQQDAAAQKSLGAYLGGDLGQLASQSPDLAFKAADMKAKQATFDLEKRAVIADQLAGMANVFAQSPTPELYQKISSTLASIDPTIKIPSYEFAVSNPDKVAAEAQALTGLSQQLKYQLEARKASGDAELLSPEAMRQKIHIAQASRPPQQATGSQKLGGFAPSEIEKIVSYKNSLPPGPDRSAVENILLRKADPSGENSISGLDAVRQPPSKTEVKNYNDQQRGIIDTISSIKLLRDHIQSNGIETFRLGPLGAKTAGDQATLYNLSLYAFKEAAEMGALQKAEFDNYAKIAPDPSSIATNLSGKEAAVSKLNIFIDNLERKRSTLDDQFARRGKGAKHEKPSVATPVQASGASIDDSGDHLPDGSLSEQGLAKLELLQRSQ